MHRELGKNVVDRMVADTASCGQPEKAAAMEGRVMSVVVAPVTPKPLHETKETSNETTQNVGSKAV